MYPRILVTVLLVSSFAFPASADERWVEARTPHFHVAANASPQEARQTALRLERFRAVVGQLFPDALLGDPVPITVLLFRNARSLRPFYPLQAGKPRPIGGMFLGGHDRNYMVVDVSAGRTAYQTPLHEYVHVLNSRVTSQVPLWMNEGLAELYGGAEIDDERVLIGGLRDDHLALLSGTRLLPTDELLAAGPASPIYNADHQRSVFYAQSWLLVHYLLFGSSGTPRPLHAYLVELAKGHAPADAARQAWGLEPSALHRRIAYYVNAGSYAAVSVPVDPLPAAQVVESPLSAADAEFYKGDLLVHDHRVGEGRPYLERAIAFDATRPGPYRSLGLGHYYAEDLSVAVRWLSAAIERDPMDGVARYFRARATLQGSGPVVGAATAAFVREDLRVAVERAPFLPDARALLAQIGKVLGTPPHPSP